MTFGSFVAICLTLAFVLALLAMTMRLLRRYAVQGGGARNGVEMKIIARLALGPRQGIAVVRVGGQTIAVSTGEGGVRALAELSDDDIDAPALAARSTAPTVHGKMDFRTALVQSIRKATMLALVVALVPMGSLIAQAGTPQQSPQTNPAPGTSTQAPGTSTSAALDALSRAAPQLDLRLGSGAAGAPNDGSGLRLSGTVGVVIMMGLLTILPTLLLMMTSFTRIIVVLNFLRQAIGAQASPPAHLVSALSLLLTFFVMSPTLTEMNRTALTPWLDGRISQGQMMTTAVVPFREFMFRQTREHDLEAFVEMSRIEPPKTADEVPTVVLMSAFVTSELRTAFQIGFALFLPFIVIDVVVSSVLMSMGMMMLPPAMIALPFKLLLFVLVDGWSLVIQSLVASFH